MQIKPNQTMLQGRVQSIRPESDGVGADVELLVVQNETPSAEEDFIRPAPGSVIKVFAAEPEKLKVGDLVRVRASLLAGPFGGRTVLESVAPVRKASAKKR